MYYIKELKDKSLDYLRIDAEKTFEKNPTSL